MKNIFKISFASILLVFTVILTGRVIIQLIDFFKGYNFIVTHFGYDLRGWDFFFTYGILIIILIYISMYLLFHKFKQLIKPKLFSISIFTIVFLFSIHSILYSYLYESMWAEFNQSIKTKDNSVVTFQNYKSVEFNRLILPMCGTCGALCFEEYKFLDDSILQVTHNLYAARDFNIYEKLLNWPDTIISEYFYQKEDSLIHKRNETNEVYMLWSFENDTLKLSEILTKPSKLLKTLPTNKIL